MLHRLLNLALATRLDRRLMALVVASEREALERQGLSLDVLHARLLQSFRAGNRRGLRGALADARLVAQPWDFSVADVMTEVELLHGTDDRWCRRRTRIGMRRTCRVPAWRWLPGELHLSMCFRSTGRIQEACQELRIGPGQSLGARSRCGPSSKRASRRAQTGPALVERNWVLEI